MRGNGFWVYSLFSENRINLQGLRVKVKGSLSFTSGQDNQEQTDPSTSKVRKDFTYNEKILQAIPADVGHLIVYKLNKQGY